MKRKHKMWTSWEIAAFKRALFLENAIHPRWSGKELAMRKEVLNKIHGKKRVGARTRK